MLPSLLVAALLLQPPEPRAEEPPPAPPEDSELAPLPPGQTRTLDGKILKEPKRTKNAYPEWPSQARRAGLTGKVTLECVVDTEGRVERDVKIVSGPRSLAEAAVTAVRKWRYTPTELDGKAVPVIMTIHVNFRLQAPPKRDDLIEVVGDSDPEIRWAAVRWLGRFRPVTGPQMRALQKASKDEDERVRGAAQEALAKIEPTPD